MSFNVSVPLEELRKRKLFVATPMYGGQCAGSFARACADLATLCKHYEIQVRFYFLFNESLIPRARNYCVDEFMRSGDTHFLFIDADISFNPNDVLGMLAAQGDDTPYDVMCGPYPKKCISWEKIKHAVDKGFADEDPEVLGKFVGDYVFNPAGGVTEIPINAPVEVLESGTGFMMIRRQTFEKFADAYPQQFYRPDHVRTEHFDGTREIVAYFDTPIDNKYMNLQAEMAEFVKHRENLTPENIMKFIGDPNATMFEQPYSKRYLSEDYMFCQWVRNIGMKVWLCPWIELQHIGSYIFGGSLKDLAMVGAPATADVNQLNKKNPTKNK